MTTLAVIGAGSWGTAIAHTLADNGHTVHLWCRSELQAEAINKTRCNKKYLSECMLPDSITAGHQLSDVVAKADGIILATPSHALRSTTTALAPFLGKTPIPIVCATKGIEVDTGTLMLDVIAECLPHVPDSHRLMLSGPSFAGELAHKQLTALVIAGVDDAISTTVQSWFRSPYLLTFRNNDVAGVQVGGAVKNVLALAAGMVDGMAMGNNARAALITRGLYEMIKLGTALGAQALTFSGLSGIGDLVLTCTGAASRNHAVGERLGRGEAIGEILASMHMVAEGVATAKAVHLVASQHKVFMPICEAVYHVVHSDITPQDALRTLTQLELTHEQQNLGG